MAAQAAVSDRLGVPGLPTLISSDPTSGVGFPTAADKVPLEWDTTYLLEDDLRMVDGLTANGSPGAGEGSHEASSLMRRRTMSAI